MKAVVVKAFYDKQKKVLRNVGEIITVSKERYEQLACTAHIQKVKKGD